MAALDHVVTPTGHIYRFGEFVLDPAERSLRSTASIAIGPRAFDVLVMLVEQAGHLVTTEELFARVWPRVIVEENNLRVQISALRKIVGAQAIETVARRGYRFTVPVEVAAKAPAATQGLPALPGYADSFIGRERDVAAVRARLAEARLVTIVGVGGLGKTRLAVHVAELAAGGFADGVCFVDLAPVDRDSGVGLAVAAALGVTDTASIVQSITTHLRDRELLLVLDNCEHLLAACTALAAELLRFSPGLRILATSRELLRMFGEAVHGLVPLAVPVDGRDDVMTCAAAELFVERARAARATFRVDHGEERTLGAIVRRLDGIPLAIELAAACVRALPMAAIEERLAHRFALLTAGDRTASSRGRTLRTMIDWSYDLLDAAERCALMRLSVFAGGCRLDDAEAVIAGGPIDAAEVVDLVARLVDKSLVVYERVAERYRLLETIREYALERLRASDEEAAVRDLHFARCLDLARQGDAAMRGAKGAAWLTRLNAERENLVAAHAWCAASQNATMGFALLDGLRIWLFCTSIELGLRMARETLGWPSGQARTRERCEGTYAAAAIAYFAGCNEDAIGWAQECHSIATDLGYDEKVVDALVVEGVAQMAAADPTRARASLEQALVLARPLRDGTRITDALCNLAEVFSADGEHAAAIPFYVEALAILRAMHNDQAIATNACNLARNRLVCGTREGVSRLLCEVLSLVDAAAPFQTMQQLFVVAAGFAAFEHDFERAAVFYGAADMDLRERGGIREPADRMFIEPVVARVSDALGGAAFSATVEEGKALSYDAAIGTIQTWLADRAE